MSTISSMIASGSYSYPATYVSPTSTPGLALTAANLSADGSIVATLGGGSSCPMTYDAAGLLNSLTQAEMAPAQAPALNGSTAQAAAQYSTNQGVLGALSSAASASGVYNSSGSLPAVSANISANWASILAANPGLASSAISAAINQGIVGTLFTLA